MSEHSVKSSSPTDSGTRIIRGIPFTSPIFIQELIEESMDYVPHDGDIIIATYPKTGTTWMQYIVHQILTKGESFPKFNDMMEKIVPFMEMRGTAAVDALTTRPRVYKHHLPYDKVQKNRNCKYIYVYRRPEDTFVSYYHFIKQTMTSLDFNQYFEDFLSGNISYGRYFEHVLSYLEREADGNILMVSYETLQAHRKEEILRIAKFIGDDHYRDISADETVLNNIIENTTFDHMKRNLTMTISKEHNERVEEANRKDTIEFFRKGRVGDGIMSLSKDQLTRLKAVQTEIMKGTKILKEWLN